MKMKDFNTLKTDKIYYSIMGKNGKVIDEICSTDTSKYDDQDIKYVADMLIKGTTYIFIELQ